MAESTTQSKRQREDNQYQCEEDSKRHKPYNQILSILEEEDEPNQDLLDLFQSLQHELSSDVLSAVDPLQISASSAEVADHQSGVSAASESNSPSSKEEDDEDDGARVMRHLLEASDDELGLPNISESGDEEINSGEHHPFFLGDGLWEFENAAAANYYTLLQSELFI